MPTDADVIQLIDIAKYLETSHHTLWDKDPDEFVARIDQYLGSHPDGLKNLTEFERSRYRVCKQLGGVLQSLDAKSALELMVTVCRHFESKAVNEARRGDNWQFTARRLGQAEGLDQAATYVETLLHAFAHWSAPVKVAAAPAGTPDPDR